MKARTKWSIPLMIVIAMIFTGCISNPMMSLRERFEGETQTADAPANSKGTQTTIQENLETSNTEVDTPLMDPLMKDKDRPTTLYLKNGQGLLVPVAFYISSNDEGIARLAVNALAYTEKEAERLKDIGLMPTLPLGTVVRNASIKNGIITLNLSAQINRFSSKVAELTGVSSIVYTLTEFSNIDQVQIQVEGKALSSLNYGTKISEPLKRSEINLISQGKIGDKQAKVMVYYQKKIGDKLTYFVPVTKLVDGSENGVEAAMNALLEGPPEKYGLYTVIPKGTKLEGVQVKDGIAYLNFSKEILEGEKNKTQEYNILKSIRLTMKSFPEIKKVRIFVEGKTIENSSGIGAEEYLTIPAFVNYFE